MPNSLNDRAARRVQRLIEAAETHRVEIARLACGATVVDCGVNAMGGIGAGLELAAACLSDLGTVALAPGDDSSLGLPRVTMLTDHPVAACMASQYAGWQVQVGDFFAMGSGPMRAAAGKEELFGDIGHREDAPQIVGVLETAKLPDDEVARHLAAACRVEPAGVTLLAARTASIAGGVQVVARSVETALHKLHELKFDLSRIVSGYGAAPLPPPARNDLAAIGRTNDAVLYGGEVTLWATGEDDSLADAARQLPSSASRDFGEPFAEIFARYEHDFYKIDPLLFSPARVTLQNVETGAVHRAGQIRPDVLRSSFGME